MTESLISNFREFTNYFTVKLEGVRKFRNFTVSNILPDTQSCLL